MQHTLNFLFIDFHKIQTLITVCIITQNLDGRLEFLNNQMNLLGRGAKNAIDKVAADADVTKADILKEFDFRKTEMMRWFEGV